MTDTEIIRTLAEKCMEWSVFSLLESGYGELIGDRLIENVAHDWIYFPSGATWSTEGLKAWNPPTSISDAFMVVERMRELGYLWAMRLLGCGDVSVQFWRNATDPHTTEESGSATEREICRAICLAAIAALERK